LAPGFFTKEENVMPILMGDLHKEWTAGKERYKTQIAADKIKFNRDLGPELDKIGKLYTEAAKAKPADLAAAMDKAKAQVKKCMEICKEYTTTVEGLKDTNARGGLKNRLKNISDTLNEKHLESLDDYRKKMQERQMR